MTTTALANGVEGPAVPDSPLEQARAVLSVRQRELAESERTLQAARDQWERRGQEHQLALTAVHVARGRLDRSESEKDAAELTAARQTLDHATELLRLSGERSERAVDSLRVARGALERAEHDVRVGELHTELAAPPVSCAHVEGARRAVGEAAAVLEIARAAFASSLASTVFERLDADKRLRAELTELGEQAPAPVSPLHLVVPWLEALLRAGRLSIDTAGPFPLTAAYASLRPLRAALLERDAGAVFDALERLVAGPPSSQAVARDLLDVLGAHRDEASAVAAIAERERPERERREREAAAISAREKAERERELKANHTRYLEDQARLGNPTARRALGLDDRLPTINGQLPPTAAQIARAAAKAFGLLDPSELK